MKKSLLIIMLILFLVPAIMAQENRALWSKTTYEQSAKINYMHVYKKTHLREDLNYCIGLIREALDKYPGDPGLYQMVGTFYSEISVDTMIIYFDSVAAICNDETVDEKIRKNCFKKDNLMKKIEDTRQKFWEESYNKGVDMITQYDTIQARMKRASTEDSITIFKDLADSAQSKADGYFDQAMRLKPDEPKSYEAAAILADRSNDFIAETNYNKKVIALRGEDADIVSRIAYAYIQVPEWDSAIVWFEKYLKYKPEDLNALTNLMVAYGVRKNNEKAHEYCQEILKIDPNNVKALTNTAQYYYNLMNDIVGQKSELLADSTNPDAKAKIAALSEQEEKYSEEAVNALTKAKEQSPQDLGILKMLGMMYLFAHKFQESADVLTEYLALNPNDANVLDYLGRAYISLGDFNKAIDPYAKIVEMDPGNVDAWDKLQELYRYTGNTEKADEAKAKIDELNSL